MTELSDRAMAHLRHVVEHPDTMDGRYAAQEEIGRGGMGVVYRARDTLLARDVALKVMNVVQLVEGASHSASERLTREAQILAHLEHPGIVPVHDTGRLRDGRVYYVMRLVRGTRLDQHAANGVRRGDLLRIMLRLCETMAFAHEHGIVHRDLKPGNVMIGPFGEVLVLDWGVAKALRSASAPDGLEPSQVSPIAGGPQDASLTVDGAVVGTPGYMAPEQASGGSARVDARADVFGLGAILRDLLATTGEPVPPQLRAIVARATAASVADRYASAMTLATDIGHWLDGESVSAYREGPLERVGRFYRRHEVAVLLIVAYAVVRTAIVLFRRP